MNRIIITVVIALVVVVGGYFLLMTPQSAAPTTSNPSPSQSTATPTAPQTPTTSSGTSQSANVVPYTDSGYSPSTLTIKAGDTVTFKNQSSKAMWTASGAHPSHRLYSGTSLDEHCGNPAIAAFDACAGTQPGDTWSFKFDLVGTWKYHNHLAPADTGTIIVQP